MRQLANSIRSMRKSTNPHELALRLLALTVITFPLILLAVWKIPQLQVGTQPLKVEEKARLDAETAARVALIQGVGGLLLFTTAGISFLSLKATQRNVAISEEKQVTDRFSKAVEMLGNEHSTYIRLGGIYALERIAKDSAKDHWQVMEILTAFVREKVRLKDDCKPFKTTIGGYDFDYLSSFDFEDDSCGDSEDYCGDSEDYDETVHTPIEGYVRPIPVEIQAILTALGRRTKTHENGEHILDLSRTNLSGAFLTGNLSGINLEGTNLQWAILKDVDLSYSKLANANLEVAKIERADLQKADLLNAQLHWTEFANANLQTSNLENANLDETKFQNSNLTQVNLKNASLWKTEFLEANPSSALNLTMEQVKSAKHWEEAIYSPEFQQKLGLPPAPENEKTKG